jgi:hypothetical protein
MNLHISLQYAVIRGNNRIAKVSSQAVIQPARINNPHPFSICGRQLPAAKQTPLPDIRNTFFRQFTFFILYR